MPWTTFAAIYFVTWWIVLFAVLPFGVRAQHEHGEVPPGTDPGAPAAPALLAKAGWTTLVTTVLVAAFWAAHAARLVDLEQFATLWGLFPR
jgi:predicted secreted protein